jgi:hypothetical protein
MLRPSRSNFFKWPAQAQPVANPNFTQKENFHE